MRRRSRKHAASAMAACLVLVSGACSAKTVYTLTDLGAISPLTGVPFAINRSGEVTGASEVTGSAGAHAFLYDGTKVIDLGSFGGHDTHGRAINSAGHVVGDSQLSGNTASHAFYYDGVKMTDLGTLGGVNSSAVGINDSGQIAGTSDLPGPPFRRAFLYENGKMKDLGSLGGPAGDSIAWAINSRGEVTGESSTPSGTHAFLYDGVKMNDLGTLPVGVYSRGTSINDLGEVTGDCGPGVYEAFLFDGTKMNVLPRFPDSGTYGDVFANGINNSGQIVGYHRGDTTHAFLYSGGITVDLNSLLDVADSKWTLDVAEGINDNGQIIGEAHDDQFSNIGYILTPHAVDTTPPTTTVALSPGVPDGTNGSYISPVTVTLTANDPDDTAANLTTYYTDNSGSTQTYISPFTVSAVGVHPITYWSVDRAGNEETPHGTITITITAAPIVPIHTFTEIGWHLISSPYTLSQTFSALSMTAFAYDPVGQAYIVSPSPPADAFHIGAGYWTYLRSDALAIPGPGTQADNTQPLTVALGQGWNLIGNPFTSPVTLSNILVNYSSGTAPFVFAESNHTVSSLFAYNSASQSYRLLQGASDSFNPWDGAWIYSKESGTQLVFNPPPR